MNLIFLNEKIMAELKRTKKGKIKDGVLELINKVSYKIKPAVYITEALVDSGNIDLKGFVLTEEELEQRGYELFGENIVAETDVFKVVKGMKGYLVGGKGLGTGGIKDTIVRLRDEHATLLEIAGKITETFSNDICDCDKINKLLHTFLNVLKAHLKAEDLYLYPSYYKDEDKKFIAQQYSKEMKGITKVVLDYFNYWDENLSQKNFVHFIEDTRGLFSALVNRIDKEESELYPIFE